MQIATDNLLKRFLQVPGHSLIRDQDCAMQIGQRNGLGRGVENGLEGSFVVLKALDSVLRHKIKIAKTNLNKFGIFLNLTCLLYIRNRL